MPLEIQGRTTSSAAPVADHDTRQQPSGVIVIPRSAEIAAAEAALSLALVAGRIWLTVSLADVRAQLEHGYHIPSTAFVVSRYAPEDFLVRFQSRENLEDVLNAPMPITTSFKIIW